MSNVQPKKVAVDYELTSTDTIVPRSSTEIVPPEMRDRLIGEILSEVVPITPAQIEQILDYQRERGILFGEAAIELGFANEDAVRYALSTQFRYPYEVAGSASGFSDELVCATAPFSAQSEAVRAIRSHLLSGALVDPNITRPIAVISPEPGEGRTYLAANLAITFSQLGRRTMLIDADFRAPRQNELFRAPKGIGLAGLLSGRNHGEVIHKVPSLPSLAVLPVGIIPPNPLELIERPAFQILVREFASKFAYIIVDTPAGIHGADARAIAARCGTALVVCRKNNSRAANLEGFVTSVRETGCNVAGVVLNEF